ncbi:MAG: DUF86 domain-containing protein [Cyanobacteria bacterium P01_H01_bin.15]
MKDERLYLSNILECIERIEQYTQSGKTAFLTQILLQDAVIRNFEVIGEASKRLSSELKAKYPEIPWKQVGSFRDFLIHDYLKINLNQIWGVVENDLPSLKSAVQSLLGDS